MGSFLACQRKHFYRYEVGLRPNTDANALRFGSAWHNAMEARWQLKTYEAALAVATAGNGLDDMQRHTLAGLLIGYCKCYEGIEIVKTMQPEVQFHHSIKGSNTFDAAGKIDGLGILHDGRLALIEHKTCSDDISHESDFWLRLRSNNQILQYVYAARMLGWNIEIVIYDVTRKPCIDLVQKPVLDENGLKIVKDKFGNRVLKANGEPRQSGNKEKEETLETVLETPDEFGDRLADDTMTRPEFYFARREVPVTDQDLEEFNVQRVMISRNILGCRHEQKKLSRPEQAWARNIDGMVCRNCEFSQFCLQNIPVNPAMPPAGFSIGAINSELQTI